MTEKEKLLDNFEHNHINKYKVNRRYVETYDISISDYVAKSGSRSLALRYHLGGWKNGNGAMYIDFKENLTVSMRPLKLGVWVYGDGKVPWLRATFRDGVDDRKTVNLTEGSINWTGWKYVDGCIDDTWQMPIRLEQIYAVEVDKTYREDAEYGGVIYFDDIRFVYVDDEDLKGPVFSDIQPEQDVVYTNTFSISAKVMDDMTGVDPSTICVLVNGEEMEHDFCQESQMMVCHFRDVAEGVYHLSMTARDYAGNISTPGLEKTITVDLSPDVEAPVVSMVTPTETAVVHTDTPRITFHLMDDKSGVEKNAIVVHLNGNRLDVFYDEKTGWGYAISTMNLSSGWHIFTIAAEDRAGNKMEIIEKRFEVSMIEPPADPEAFQLTIIPDTHSIENGDLALCRAAQDESAFVLHMGDMVDQGTEAEFDAFIKKRKEVLPNKQLLTVAGNHESFLGDLDTYMDCFGSPAYHLEYGNMLLIVLHSSYEQSISVSDSTQFHYLKRLLANNRKDHVLIATHVPTKDDFGTSHDMNQADALELENVLGRFKKENMDVNVTVLFGHLHVLHRWEKDGINYIITGNGSGKSYVGDRQKNRRGRGILIVTGGGMQYNYHPYSVMNETSHSFRP